MGATSAGVTSAIDPELDGVPSNDAEGDDSTTTGVDDEDGIRLINPQFWRGGQTGTLEAAFSTSSPDGSGSGYLVVWFDWNHNGEFEDAEASVNTAVSWTAASGNQTFSFTVPFCSDFDPSLDPNNCPIGKAPLDAPLYYRARLFAAAPTTPAAADCGQVSNGEVEDYLLNVAMTPPPSTSSPSPRPASRRPSC